MFANRILSRGVLVLAVLATVVLGLTHQAGAQQLQTETMDIILSSGGAGNGNPGEYPLYPEQSTTEIAHEFSGEVVRVSNYKVVDGVPDAGKFQYRIKVIGGQMYLTGKSNGQPGLVRVRISAITR